jgi:hypothetical protein
MVTFMVRLPGLNQSMFDRQNGTNVLSIVKLNRHATAMKYDLFFFTILGMTIITSPASAQFSSFPSTSDSCSSLCVKLDLGSANNESSFGSSFNSGFGDSTNNNNRASNLRWQVGVTWRPNPPEVVQVEGDKVKQRLDDNRSLMIALAEAISQNRTEMARGLAILLAPRLGYNDHRKLLAEMKEGASNVRPAPVETPNPPSIDKKETSPNPSPPSIEIPKGSPNTNPAPVETPPVSPSPIPAPIELK